MATEYKIMMNKDGKWYKAHVNCQGARITNEYKDAVKEMKRVEQRRAALGNPADAYKIMRREVTDWIDA